MFYSNNIRRRGRRIPWSAQAGGKGPEEFPGYRSAVPSTASRRVHRVLIADRSEQVSSQPASIGVRACVREIRGEARAIEMTGANTSVVVSGRGRRLHAGPDRDR